MLLLCRALQAEQNSSLWLHRSMRSIEWVASWRLRCYETWGAKNVGRSGSERWKLEFGCDSPVGAAVRFEWVGAAARHGAVAFPGYPQMPGAVPAAPGKGGGRSPHTYTTGQVIAFVLVVAVLVAVIAGLIGSNMAREAAQKEHAQLEEELTVQIEQLEQERDELQALYDQAIASGGASAGATSDEPTIEIDVDDTVASAKAQLQEAIDSAKAWLDSDAGQAMQGHVRLALQNAIDIASRLIEESGIADPQTYIDAANAITAIIDEETAENAQEAQDAQQ